MIFHRPLAPHPLISLSQSLLLLSLLTHAWVFPLTSHVQAANGAAASATSFLPDSQNGGEESEGEESEGEEAKEGVDGKADGDNPGEAQSDQNEAGPITALVHCRIFTMADAGEIEDGTILIQGGKILAVGTDVEVPEGAEVVDVTGMQVTPGLIDLRSELWLTSAAAGDTGSTAALDVLDGVDPYSRDWREVAKQGITAVYVQPSARGSLGGYGALIRVAEGRGNMDGLVIVNHAGFQSSLGVGTSKSSTKAKVAEFTALKKRFSEAKEYAEQWEKYRDYQEAQAKKKAKQKKEAGKEKQGEAGEKEANEQADDDAAESKEKGSKNRASVAGPGPQSSGDRSVNAARVASTADLATADRNSLQAGEDKPEDSPNSGNRNSKETKDGDEKDEEKPPKKPEQDLLKDRLVRILEGEVPLRMEVHGLDDVERALEFAKEFEITIILEGLSDLATSKQLVAQSSLPVVLGPWLDSERESYHAKDRVALWSDCFSDYAGRLVIASFARSSRGSKQLRYHAAAAVAAGFNAQQVLESITANAALLAGAGDSHGKIKAGFAADLTVFAGHPLDPATAVVMTLSAGTVTYRAPEMPPVVERDRMVEGLEFPLALPDEYAIKSQRILSDSGQFEPGLLHIADGKIKGRRTIDEEISGVRIVDVGAAVVTPGLITAHAELALAALVDRQGLADSGPVRAADVYDALLPVNRRLVDGGFLRAASAPASDRVIAGQAAELRLLAKDPIVNAELAEKVVLSNSARSRERFPSSLAGQQQLIRDALSGKVEPSPLYLPAAALSVLDKARAERQQAIVEGKRPVLMLVETDAEIATAVKLLRETGVRGLLAGADQWKSAVALLATFEGDAAKPGCIVRPINSEDYDWYASDLAELVSGGTTIAFGGEDPLAIRKTVAAIVQAGVPAAAALRGLTVDAASMLGMSPEAGRLAPGSAADFVVWNGSPLNLAAQPVAIVIDGSLVDGKTE